MENQAEKAGDDVCRQCKSSYYISPAGVKIESATVKNAGTLGMTLEQKVSTIANIALFLGIGASIILFFLGIFSFGETRDGWGRVQATTGWAQLLLSVYVTVISLAVWALLSVLSNISTSLKEVNAKTKGE